MKAYFRHILPTLNKLLIILFIISTAFISLYNWDFLINLNLSFANFEMKLGSLIIFFAIFAILIFVLLITEKRNNLTPYKTELEKSKISDTTNSERVKVLEAKIKTLEKVIDNLTKQN